MNGNEVIMMLLQEEERLLLVLGAGVFTIWVVLAAVSKTLMTMARERTKRDIAAYIAEGSMTPEQGERLVKAGKNETNRCG